MTTSEVDDQPEAGGGARSFELWMVANLANRAGYHSFVRTAGLVSLAGLLNIGVFIFGGRWMGRSGLAPVLVTGHAMRLIGALGMVVLGLAADAPELLVIAFVQILYQALPFVRLSQPVGAMRYSTSAAIEASGWVIGASAVGSSLGGMVGGSLPTPSGYH